MARNNSYILLTGGAGYIGSHVALQFTKYTQKKLIILDNLSSGHKTLINKKSKFLKADINNKALMKSIFSKYRIDTVIHLAAKSISKNSFLEKNKFIRTNYLATKKLCKLCLEFNVKYFIFTSSASVYGNKKGAISENSKTLPLTPYGISKLKAEKEIVKLFNKKIKFAILRLFNVAGADYKNNIGLITNNDSIFKNFSKKFLNKYVSLNVYGKNYKKSNDGTTVRDYINVIDVAKIILNVKKFLEKNNKSITINCGSGEKTSVLDLIKIFKKITKKNYKINFNKKRKGDIEISIAKIKKLKKILKFYPTNKNSKTELIAKSSLLWEKKLIQKTFL